MRFIKPVFSQCERKIFANSIPIEDLIATLAVNVKKKDSLVAKFSKSKKSVLEFPLNKVLGF